MQSDLCSQACLEAIQGMGTFTRESRYSSWFLRRKTATRGTDGEREAVSKRPGEVKPG
jgi:hypothetical protein